MTGYYIRSVTVPHALVLYWQAINQVIRRVVLPYNKVSKNEGKFNEVKQGNIYAGGGCTTACAVVNQLLNKLFWKIQILFSSFPTGKLKVDWQLHKW